MASVHMLDGRLKFGVDGKDREMRANDWLIMPPNAPHRLSAIEPTRFVLTLFKRGA
jgi:quercetin dioxygenase-like cupin family protein